MMEPQLRPGLDLNDITETNLKLFARVKDGATREGARQEAATLTAAWVASNAEPMAWSKNYTDARLVPLSGLPEDATKAIVGFFFLLLGASALVLLISSVNVGAMLSARAVARRREMAVRAALGAGGGTTGLGGTTNRTTSTNNNAISTGGLNNRGAFGGQGSQTAFGPRGAANLLTRLTTWSAILFTCTSIGLTILMARSHGPHSVLEGTTTSAPAKSGK